MKRLVFLMAAVMLMAFGAEAKEMNHRLGVGPKWPFSIDLPGIGIHYFPNSDYCVTGALGIETEKGSSAFGLQGGIRRIFFEERNLNFFVGGAFGILSNEVAGSNSSGFEMMALSGGEFFFEGLDNLGFNFQMGVGVQSLKSATRFFTVAHTPVQGGVIFYF
ncbi:MAG: hypothetical protein RJB66_1311 [Pseudomonadota bacterium]|jgi:hypothetical protein